MPERLSSSYIFLGVSLALAALWVLTSLAVLWDSSHRDFTRVERVLWIAAAVLLPLFGFAVYLGGLVVRYYFGPPAPPHPVMARPPALRDDPDPEIELERTQAGGAAGAGRGARFLLEVESGPQSGEKIVLRHFPALIGRGSTAVVALNADSYVSRRHAEIFTRQGILTIRDLHSMRGTLVNGAPVRDRALRPGDRIQVGETVLVLSPVE